MTSTQLPEPRLPEPKHVFKNQQGSAIWTRCGRLLELGPSQQYTDIGVYFPQEQDKATCPLCRHPSNHP